MNGTIFNIQHFCTQDGPGIRTTVFLKGCPLHCVWCHNPESHVKTPELMFYPEKCIGCGACASVCPEHHRSVENMLRFDRKGCLNCGRCATVCPAEALVMSGKTVSVEEVMTEVLQDALFYTTSGGGMTLSGGEPLYQPEFSLALAKAAKENNITVAIETSGCVSGDTLLRFLPYTDLFLYDLKHSDDAAHRRYTGISLMPVLDNLRLLLDAGAQIILRCPIIPEINFSKSHFEFIAEIAGQYKGLIEIQFEPYHPLGLKKAETLGKSVSYDYTEFLSREAVLDVLRDIPFSIPVKVN